jgi:hypothetical protein
MSRENPTKEELWEAARLGMVTVMMERYYKSIGLSLLTSIVSEATFIVRNEAIMASLAGLLYSESEVEVRKQIAVLVAEGKPEPPEGLFYGDEHEV